MPHTSKVLKRPVSKVIKVERPRARPPIKICCVLGVTPNALASENIDRAISRIEDLAYLNS